MSDIIIYITLAIAVWALLTSLFKTPSSGMQPGSYWAIPTKSTTETLAELKAEEELNRDYEFVIPDYGMYLGEKIPLGQETEEMLTSPMFRTALSMGEWKKRQPDTGKGEA